MWPIWISGSDSFWYNKSWLQMYRIYRCRSLRFALTFCHLQTSLTRCNICKQSRTLYREWSAFVKRLLSSTQRTVNKGQKHTHASVLPDSFVVADCQKTATIHCNQWQSSIFENKNGEWKQEKRKRGSISLLPPAENVYTVYGHYPECSWGFHGPFFHFMDKDWVKSAHVI